jgi:hypothetical protein
VTTTHPTDPDADTDSDRPSALRRRLPDPMAVALLGFISIPGYLFDALEPLRIFVLFFLAGLWPLLTGLVSTVVGIWTDDRTDAAPTEWIDTGDRATNARALVSMLLLQFQPVLFGTGIAQMAGHIPIYLRYRGHLPSPESFESDIDYRLPFEGTWTVVNGSPDRDYSHSWGILTQRYAYDFVITDADGRTHEGERTSPEGHYCFGEPILAPAEGTVVSVRNDHRAPDRRLDGSAPAQHHREQRRDRTHQRRVQPPGSPRARQCHGRTG